MSFIMNIAPDRLGLEIGLIKCDFCAVLKHKQSPDILSSNNFLQASYQSSYAK